MAKSKSANSNAAKNTSKSGKSNNGSPKDIPKSNNSKSSKAGKSQKNNESSSKQHASSSSSSSSKLFWVSVLLVSAGVGVAGVYFSAELKDLGEQVLNDFIHPQVLVIQDYVKSLQDPQEQKTEDRHKRDVETPTEAPDIEGINVKVTNKREEEEKMAEEAKQEKKREEERKLEAERQKEERKRKEIEAERKEKERLEKQRKDQEKKEEEMRKEQERKEREKKEAEKKEQERKEKERIDAERKELERKEKEAEKKELERKIAERKEKEKLEAEKRENERREAEKKEQERREAEKKEQERRDAELKEQERKEAERKEQARKDAERKEQVRREAEKKEAERKEQERREAEKKEQERGHVEKKEQERREAERKEQERKDVERKEQERRDAERKEQERKELERKEVERKEQERREQEKKESLKKAEERKLKERKEAEQREQERHEALKKEAERNEQERINTLRKEEERREVERKEKEKATALKKEQERRDSLRKEQEMKKSSKQEEKTNTETYTKTGITSVEDMKIRKELDDADSLLEKENYEAALKKFDEILNGHPDSPRAVYGKGITLDKLGFKHMSNDYLEQSISFLDRVLSLNGVPDDLMKLCGRKLAERQQFRGWGRKAVKTFKILVERFPDDLKLLNEFGVQYLLIGQNERAREVFKDVLAKRESDGFAKAHLGFILKTTANDLRQAIPLLMEGIESGEEGTSDGRFYVRLGDALLRIGSEQEARHYFKEAEDKGLFLSEWQRSLYNVNELTGKPFWDPEQAGYQKYAKLLEENWQVIRDEGLSQLNVTTGAFVPEDENLRDTGDWKQLTLYMQGRKNTENCARTPKTCALIDQIPEARGCRRGQVKFSVMSPGIHVWPHTGPTNCRLRGHLGLVVPEGPSLRVVREMRTWKEGKMFIFDDSFEHEVWHTGSELRLILIVDFWHPELTERQRKTLSPI